jgi:hypothetical protein
MHEQHVTVRSIFTFVNHFQAFTSSFYSFGQGRLIQRGIKTLQIKNLEITHPYLKTDRKGFCEYHTLTSSLFLS